jgi:hypothetical protein
MERLSRDPTATTLARISSTVLLEARSTPLRLLRNGYVGSRYEVAMISKSQARRTRNYSDDRYTKRC